MAKTAYTAAYHVSTVCGVQKSSRSDDISSLRHVRNRKIRKSEIKSKTQVDRCHRNIDDDDQTLFNNIDAESVRYFGQENKDYIACLDLTLLTRLIRNYRDDRLLLEYIKLLRMDPLHPENQNIRIHDPDENTMLKHTQAGWIRMKAIPNGLWDVLVTDFFALKQLLCEKSSILRGRAESVWSWIDETEKKIQKSSFNDAGDTLEIMIDLKMTFTKFRQCQNVPE